VQALHANPIVLVQSDFGFSHSPIQTTLSPGLYELEALVPHLSPAIW
jgi:hypothetical protein